MGRKPLFYIYGRREMGVLVLLGLTIALFAFTLGIHLGKEVGGKHMAQLEDPRNPEGDQKSVETSQDVIPDRLEIADQAKKAQDAADAALNQALHNEVVRTGIRLDTPRQVTLPDDSVSGKGGETTLKEKKKAKREDAKAARLAREEDAALKAAKEAEEKAAQKVAQDESASGEKKNESGAKKVLADLQKLTKKITDEADQSADSKGLASSGKGPSGKAPSGKFTIQIGSHPSKRLASEHLEQLDALGVDSFMREAQVKGEKWYRVYLGGYGSVKEATSVGNRYKKQHVIDSFMVSKMPKSN